MHPDDAVAEKYLHGSEEDRMAIADAIARLPVPRRVVVAKWCYVAILVALLIVINILLHKLQVSLISWPVLLVDVAGVLGTWKVMLLFDIARPSVYNMLAEYKARGGHVPPF